MRHIAFLQMPMLLLSSLFLTSPGLASTPLKSQRLYVPVDMSSGVAFGRGEPRPYVLGGRVAPAVGFGTAGQIRLGVQGVALYQNPDWFGGFGPSVTLRLHSVSLEEVALLAVLDHMWWQGDRPSSGAALIFDLDGMFRLGLRVDRDWPGESTSYLISVGADIPNGLKVLRGHRSGPPSLPSDDGSSGDLP